MQHEYCEQRNKLILRTTENVYLCAHIHELLITIPTNKVSPHSPKQSLQTHPSLHTDSLVVSQITWPSAILSISPTSMSEDRISEHSHRHVVKTPPTAGHIEFECCDWCLSLCLRCLWVAWYVWGNARSKECVRHFRRDWHVGLAVVLLYLTCWRINFLNNLSVIQ